jgi:hypothetical protein
MKLASKIDNKSIELIKNGYVSSQAKFPNGESLKSGRSESILDLFQKAVDNDSFYKAAEEIFSTIDDPREVAKCAELASRREPGGAFYRVKLWAKASKLIDFPENTDLNIHKLCNQISANPTKVKNLVCQGKAIIEVEGSGVDVSKLREASSSVFQNAQRQKDRTREYLIEAINFLEENSDATHTQIHRNWCKKNGSIKSNLDIIKPSDWWAFSHPKWRREKDFPGSIPGEVYANALYYFAPRSGIAVDPMAGSGMLKRVYDDRDLWQKDSNFNLKVSLFDLHPCRHFIKQHDARKPLPVKADWIFIDPSYYGQSSHLFKDNLATAKSYDSYILGMKEIIIALSKSLNPNGKLCVFLPKWSGLKPEDPNHDIPADVSLIALACGLHWFDTAYVSRARQQEPGSAAKNNMAKRYRRMRSDTCVLNVFEKQGNKDYVQ